MLRIHPKLIARGKLLENPFYVGPSADVSSASRCHHRRFAQSPDESHRVAPRRTCWILNFWLLNVLFFFLSASSRLCGSQKSVRSQSKNRLILAQLILFFRSSLSMTCSFPRLKQ